MKRFLNTAAGARVKGLGVLAVGSLAFLSSGYPIAAAAEDAARSEALKVHYDIPRQPLSTALKALADAADIQLVYAADIVGDFQVEALKGDSVREARSGAGPEYLRS